MRIDPAAPTPRSQPMPGFFQQTRPAPRAAMAADRFEASAQPTGPQQPPPVDGRTAPGWQQYSEQFRGQATQWIDWKRSSGVPDPAIQGLIAKGQPSGPVYAGAWSTLPGHENMPVFFQNFPSDQNVQAQVYAFKAPDGWKTFEVAKDVLKAYSDPSYLSNRLGTSSRLGFPTSGRCFADGKAGDPPWTSDPEVRSAIGARGAAAFQNFENGTLVELGDGRIQAFDTQGQRMGTAWPSGKIDEPSRPLIPGVTPAPEFQSLYQSYEVTPGISVPSRIGVHWGPDAGYSNTQRIDAVVQQLQQRGVGFVTVVIDPANVQQQKPTIDALVKAGIQPLARLLPGSSYGEVTMDALTEPQMQQMADAAKQLRDMGVKVVQLDNEPNWGNARLLELSQNPGSPEFKAAISAYAANTAHVMELIDQKAPGMAIGFGALNPMPDAKGWWSFHTSSCGR